MNARQRLTAFLEGKPVDSLPLMPITKQSKSLSFIVLQVNHAEKKERKVLKQEL